MTMRRNPWNATAGRCAFHGIGEDGQRKLLDSTRDAVRLRRPRHRAGQRPGARRRRPSAPGRPRLHRDEQPAAAGALRRARRGREPAQGRGRRPQAGAPSTPASTSSRSSPTSTAPTSSTWCQDADLILDGTDNFEIRYLINDVAVKLDKPWVYGGCIGSHGQTMTILPGETPCLRCVFEAAPAPGEAGTCETAGVLGPIVNIVASFQAAEAFKILTGQLDTINRELIYFDVWENVMRRIKIAPLLGKVDCPCCQRRQLRVARRRARLADDEPVRPQRRAGVAPRRRQAQLRGDGPRIWRRWARSATTASCSSSTWTTTSSPCSPTAGRSSRAPATWTRRGRCTRSTSGIDRRPSELRV